jgi:hypothetical protein
LSKEILDGNRAQVYDRDAANDLLRRAVGSVNDGDPYAHAKQYLDGAQAVLTSARAAADALLKETLDPLSERVDALGAGKKVREDVAAELDQIRRRVVDGRYSKLEEAKRALTDPNVGAKAKIDTFENLVKAFEALPNEKQREVAAKMDEAATLSEIRQVLIDAGAALPAPRGGLSFSFTPSVPVALAQPFHLTLRRKLQLSLGALAVTLILYLFVLVVGWISLYIKSTTFGADPMSYISLFLWGGAVEAVRGKTVSVTGLKAIVS